jgi:hypothetical protein
MKKAKKEILTATKKMIYQARLKQLESNGTLTASAVLADARDPRSPLNSWFDWDDSSAAEKYRLAQARRLILHCSLKIIRNEVSVTSIIYVRDPDLPPNVQGYASLESLVDDPERARRALDLELDRLAASFERGRSLASALGLEARFDRWLEELERFRLQLETLSA